MSLTTNGGRSHSEEKDAAEIKKAIATGSRDLGRSNAAGEGPMALFYGRLLQTHDSVLNHLLLHGIDINDCHQ